MTIVGIERRREGDLGLIVFDPSHRDSLLVKDLREKSTKRFPAAQAILLQPYRCSLKYLRKYSAFEIIMHVLHHRLFCLRFQLTTTAIV